MCFFSFLYILWGEKAFILICSQNEGRKQKETTNRTLEDTIINILRPTRRARTSEPFAVPVFLFIGELCWATKERVILVFFMTMMNSKLGGVKSYWCKRKNKFRKVQLFEFPYPKNSPKEGNSQKDNSKFTHTQSLELRLESHITWTNGSFYKRL